MAIPGYGVALVVIAIVIAISITWTNFIGAPWVPTSMKTVRKMLEMADVGPEDVVYDLGCGDGRTVIAAVKRYGARAVGVEIDPLRYFWCQMLVSVLGLRDRIEIVFGDIFTQDLSGADVVTCYLLQETNEKLERKLMQELHAGARVVSNTFTFPTMKPVRQDGDIWLYLVNRSSYNQSE